jgi:hypothetical protein
MVNTSLRYIKPESDHLRTKARPLSNFSNNDMEGNMSNFISVDQFNNKAQKALADEANQWIESRNHYDVLKEELGYETIWDMGDVKNSFMTLDTVLYSDKKPIVVTYKVIKEMGASFDDVTWITFTAVAKDGTVGEMWGAAEALFQQAKLATGDWHTFIEGFDEADDGSLELIAGS